MNVWPTNRSLLKKLGLLLCAGAAATVILVVSTAVVFAEQTPQEAFADYTDFATYDAGIILPSQITDDVVDSFVFIDTRTAEEFDEETIEGALNIEWREVFSRVDEIPTEKKVVLFCNTGALSAQTAFGLRVMGYENVLILQGGFQDWKAR
ncbi:rhodanese-like domain-containing protein [Planktotalea sp.]|uniref:rhodanese-like domain-containing protein n=1 Tax=Planktotalea sp. TaxID=2029877 RepID=UPI0032980720